MQSCTNLDARFEMTTTTVDLISRKIPFLANLSVSYFFFKLEEKSDELSFAFSTCSQVEKDVLGGIQF